MDSPKKDNYCHFILETLFNILIRIKREINQASLVSLPLQAKRISQFSKKKAGEFKDVNAIVSQHSKYLKKDNLFSFSILRLANILLR